MILLCGCRVDECWPEAGGIASSSQADYLKEILGMAKNAGEDHVQVCGALCGHEEGQVCKRWPHPVPYCVPASECQVTRRSDQVLLAAVQ